MCIKLMLLGSVKVWDPRQRDKPVANMSPAEGEEGRDCWCVAFGKTICISYEFDRNVFLHSDCTSDRLV